MRLIDKDEIMEQLGMYESCRECVSVSSVSTNLPLCTKGHDFSLACGAISDAPIIDAVPVKDLLPLYEEMENAPGNTSELVFDEKSYQSDFGYAFDGIKILINVLRQRYGKKPDVRCKDCKYYKDRYCKEWYMFAREDETCSFAERREDDGGRES